MFCKTLPVQYNLTTSVLTQGVLRLIWSGRLECVFVDPKGAKISKNGNNIICRLSKNKYFLFIHKGVAEILGLPRPLEI